MYAMLCTRPDIAHAVSLTSRYQSDPGMEHWTAVKNILKYLKRTKDMFLCYGGDQELVVTSYTDASWNTDPDDSKSQSGYVFILNGAAVSWSSSKQCTVAKSSTESEYIAASEASSEAVWMKRFIVELGVVPSALDPLVIYCDNTGAIANAKEPRSHKKLKHIKLRFHSIREYIEDGEVEICKERDEPHSYHSPSLDGELLLLMGAAAVMKMAVEMAAVSMEKPSGHFPAPAGCRNRDSVPDLGFATAALRNFSRIVAFSLRVFGVGLYIGERAASEGRRGGQG
ncbi:hypothetical protein QYE76_025420 [Lolium multiflorum]|uniref:Retrotransposon protein n=1 Tax=Lolium multiflorum TaxID=4521 RepID=A0AAD8RIJ0_LOLMU|nr:hypothetical protein QYE76_025420 [Lolium multiflorum]